MSGWFPAADSTLCSRRATPQRFRHPRPQPKHALLPRSPALACWDGIRSRRCPVLALCPRLPLDEGSRPQPGGSGWSAGLPASRESSVHGSLPAEHHFRCCGDRVPGPRCDPDPASGPFSQMTDCLLWGAPPPHMQASGGSVQLGQWVAGRRSPGGGTADALGLLGFTCPGFSPGL